MAFYELDGELVDRAKLALEDHNLAIIALNDGTILEVDYWTTRLVGGVCYVALQDLDLGFEWTTLRR